MNDELIIGGVTMPTLKLDGLTITKEKIWSSNTGRSASGEMIGDVVNYKYTLKCEWPPLTREQVAIIDQAVTPAFFSVTFSNPATNKRTTTTFYAGTPTYKVYSYVNGIKTYHGVAVDLIQK